MTLALPQQQDASLRGRHSAASDGSEAAAAHLAHDTHNWLTVLQVYCDLLRTSGAVTGKGQQWIEELSNAVERGHGLVDSLLQSVHKGPVPPASPVEVPAPTPIDLAAAIERRLPLLRAMAGSQIRIDVKTVAQAGPTALKEGEFERILLNLVRNAIEAMPDGGRLRIALERGPSSERPTLTLRVTDTGNGIAPGLLPHIFDSGVSTKRTPADPPRARGLGLAIVRELTLGAGGSLRVRSKLGQGTSFHIELPLLSRPLRSASASRAGKLAAVSEMPKPKTDRRTQHHNCDANRKGTRVPC